MGFLEDYFIRPTLEHTGYNLVNTLTYAIILIVVLFAIYKLLTRLEIKLDSNLWFNLLPFVFLGGILRALQDINFFEFLGAYHVLFMAPLIYIIIFLLAFVSIIISKYLWKDFVRFFGIALVIIFLVPVAMNAKNIISLTLIFSVAALSYGILYVILKYAKINLMKMSYNSQITAVHILDASAAFVAVSVIGGYRESSLFTSFFFSQLPGWTFILLKVAVVLAALHFIDKDNKDGTNWILKFAVLVLGLGPALHNTFSVFMGSNMI